MKQDYRKRVREAFADLHKTLTYARKINVKMDCEDIGSLAESLGKVYGVKAISITNVYYGFTAY